MFESSREYCISNFSESGEESDDSTTLNSRLRWGPMLQRLQNFNEKTGYVFSPMQRIEGGFMHKDDKLELHIRFRGKWHFPFLDGREIDPDFTVMERGCRFSIIWKPFNGKVTKKDLKKLEDDFIDCFGFARHREYRR